MSLLWIAFYVLIALFLAAIVAKIGKRIARHGHQPQRSERPWR
ncbi:hypothetical protein [Ramlibacter paludis]|nr:hypothetical protein [Ramlibacter paludis]